MYMKTAVDLSCYCFFVGRGYVSFRRSWAIPLIKHRRHRLGPRNPRSGKLKVMILNFNSKGILPNEQLKSEIFLWIVSLGCFCTVLHYFVYFIQLFNVNCHWTKSGSLYDAVNQWTSPSLDKRPGSESFSTKKDFSHIFC